MNTHRMSRVNDIHARRNAKHRKRAMAIEMYAMTLAAECMNGSSILGISVKIVYEMHSYTII
jgi:hypothetical protein